MRIDASEDEEIIRQLLRAHEYWRMKQLTVDLVILNEQTSSYAQQDLQASLEAQVRTSQSRTRHEGTHRTEACLCCVPISCRPRIVPCSRPPHVRCS